MIPERYILYLDILGFSEMAQEPERVLDLYQIMDRLNVHTHHAFCSLVFSDTMVVYNLYEPQNADERRYHVMFLAEFAQDLLFRLIGRDYYFRAILTKGEFFHEGFKNFEAFFGQALINSYRHEEKLIGCGLFIDDSILSENQIFPTLRHCDRYHYVFLTQRIQDASWHGEGGFPFPGELLDDTSTHFQTYAELCFLKEVYRKSRQEADPKVRSKFQATWGFYEQRFPALCETLRTSNFDFNAIADANWTEAEKHFREELRSDYYKYNASSD
jgi:hypothetical protein